jgi:hypothetical protein
MTNFLVEHNLPISTADHLSPLLSVMFPDSKIAKEFACKRTKATYILHEIAGDCQRKVVQIIGKLPFTILTDGSNDRGRPNGITN